jgi:hypothetical protein
MRADRDVLRVGRADHLRDDFGEDQDEEAGGGRRDREDVLARAEEAARDLGNEDRRHGVDHGVAREDEGEELVRAIEERAREPRAAAAFADEVLQAIAVHRHQAGLGTREEARAREQHRERGEQPA